MIGDRPSAPAVKVIVACESPVEADRLAGGSGVVGYRYTAPPSAVHDASLWPTPATMNVSDVGDAAMAIGPELHGMTGVPTVAMTVLSDIRTFRIVGLRECSPL